jgi:hypothetical protein
VAGPFLAAAKFEMRLLVSFIKPPRVLYAVSDPPVACGQRVCVVHMSIGLGERAFAPEGHRHAIAERPMKAARVVQPHI